ncbi:hypothetical protein [Pedobacter aquatilis]|uniref:hypothetical protein n=1 Tax=Pedobacter aquatilis TaxID=351343 RepID=UPI00292E73E3|nr:hypothetical protein [Pedobacter aquatilis]
MEHKIQTAGDKSVLGFISRLSWGAIIAGVLIAIAVQLLLSFLGLGIGFGSINPLDEAKPFSGLGMGALVWWIVSMLISVFSGGWVAGWFSSHVQRTDLVLHGLLTWCLLTFLNMYLITSSVGKIIGGAGSVITKGFSLAGEGIKAVAPEAGKMVKDQLGVDENTFGKMKQEAERLLKQTEKKELQPGSLDKKINQASGEGKSTGKEILENPQEAQQRIDALISKLFSQNDSTFEAADKEALVNIVRNRTGKSQAESEQIVDNWITTIKTAREKVQEVKAQAEAKAREVGDEMASALSKFALFSFFGMLVGAVSASYGAIIASNKRLVVVQEVPESSI